MLTDLSITNIAIIDQLNLSLKPGLTILTGETGAGKSIIIDAVGLIMGGRASADLIRAEADEAVVEAIFDISCLPDIRQMLDESGFECDNELLVKRIISRSGKNRVFINGSMATLSLLADISQKLINIYGQHESQTLLRPDNQMLLLDACAECSPLREAFSALHACLSSIKEQIARFDEDERDAVRKMDLLSFQADEIGQADVKPGEDDSLEEQRQVLAHAEKLGTRSAEAFEQLYGGDGALLGQLRRICTSIRDISSIDHGLGELASSLDNAYLQLEDAAITLRGYSSKIEADPATLRKIDDRLDQINRLKRKYGSTIDDILAFKQQVDTELEQLGNRERDRNHLESEQVRLTEELHLCGRQLSARRAAAAPRLKKELEAEVHQLAMKHALLEAVLVPLDEPRSSGFERVEFLFSPNPGEPPRPLAKIASGGELSRLMLAIKQVLPEGDVPTLVFDEVDTGIGGATSDLVGRKLKNVAERQQVLCITHLPQVAAFADQHLKVEKQIGNNRTSTTVTHLTPASRIEEVARMLGGATITETTRTHAREMIAAACT